MRVRPDDPRLADGAVEQRAVYIHIPFCARICPYCDFAVVAGRDDLVERYVDATVAEIGRAEPWAPVHSIYIGGGTPSRLPAAALGRLIEAVDQTFGIEADAEVSMEANPEDLSADHAAEVAAAGVNRISLGAQSFDSNVLAYLGRRHEGADVVQAVDAVRQAGIAGVNIDVIFGSPGESPARWRQTVDAVRALDVAHVSAYALTVERGTQLGRAVAAGAPAPDPDVQADAYELLDGVMESAGLVRYEVSNWARPGHHCVYNLITWAHGEYEAVGLGAHRHRNGTRSWNVRNLDTYLDRIERTMSPILGKETLTGSEAEAERLMVGLRRAAGVEAGAYGAGWAAGEEARRFVEAGVVEVRDGRLVVRKPLFTDAVARSVLQPAE